MVFVFSEGGILEVVGSIEEAERSYDGRDVESEVVVFFDAGGIYLKPVFTRPNVPGKFFGLLGRARPGEFRLAPSADDEPDHDIRLQLFEAGELRPNPWFRSLAEVKEYLALCACSNEPARPHEDSELR